MADQPDNLGLSLKRERAAPGTGDPVGVADAPASGAASLPLPDLSRPNPQSPEAAPPPKNASPPLSPTDPPNGRDTIVEPRKLIVGPGISLSGEITSCDRLVIEGNVQANLQNCKSLTIAESGLFYGNAAIDEVDVHGRFEGDLAVRKRLLIRASGHVAGTIAYREIEIEAGGRISGSIEAANR